MGLRQERGKSVNKRDNHFHPTIKFPAEISENQKNHFSRYHGFQQEKIRKKFHLEYQNLLEADRDFPITHFASCHPPGVKYGSLKASNKIA